VPASAVDRSGSGVRGCVERDVREPADRLRVGERKQRQNEIERERERERELRQLAIGAGFSRRMQTGAGTTDKQTNKQTNNRPGTDYCHSYLEATDVIDIRRTRRWQRQQARGGQGGSVARAGKWNRHRHGGQRQRVRISRQSSGDQAHTGDALAMPRCSLAGRVSEQRASDPSMWADKGEAAHRFCRTASTKLGPASCMVVRSVEVSRLCCREGESDQAWRISSSPQTNASNREEKTDNRHAF
jgi:hypothetical protein